MFLVFTFIGLLTLVIILTLQLKKKTSCGVFLKSNTNQRLKIIDKDKWQKYYQELLPCENKLMTIYSFPHRGNIKIRQVRLVLTDRSDLTKTKRWQE
jgi:hypothetical protein